MQAPVRRYADLILLTCLVGVGAAWFSRAHRAVHVPRALAAQASLAQPAVDTAEGPLIPQICRPIGRYAPVQYRDAFSPEVGLLRRAPRRLFSHGLFHPGGHSTMRDPFAQTKS
jgi:hypothetical protein